MSQVKRSRVKRNAGAFDRVSKVTVEERIDQHAKVGERLKRAKLERDLQQAIDAPLVPRKGRQ